MKPTSSGSPCRRPILNILTSLPSEAAETRGDEGEPTKIETGSPADPSSHTNGVTAPRSHPSSSSVGREFRRRDSFFAIQECVSITSSHVSSASATSSSSSSVVCFGQSRPPELYGRPFPVPGTAVAEQQPSSSSSSTTSRFAPLADDGVEEDGNAGAPIRNNKPTGTTADSYAPSRRDVPTPSYGSLCPPGRVGGLASSSPEGDAGAASSSNPALQPQGPLQDRWSSPPSSPMRLTTTQHITTNATMPFSRPFSRSTAPVGSDLLGSETKGTTPVRSFKSASVNNSACVSPTLSQVSGKSHLSATSRRSSMNGGSRRTPNGMHSHSQNLSAPSASAGVCLPNTSSSDIPLGAQGSYTSTGCSSFMPHLARPTHSLDIPAPGGRSINSILTLTQRNAALGHPGASSTVSVAWNPMSAADAGPLPPAQTATPSQRRTRVGFMGEVMGDHRAALPSFSAGQASEGSGAVPQADENSVGPGGGGTTVNSRTDTPQVNSSRLGTSKLFYNPCSICGREMGDEESVFRCEECNYMECDACHGLSPEEKEKVVRRSSTPFGFSADDVCSSSSTTVSAQPAEGAGGVDSDETAPSVHSHAHKLKQFRWRVTATDVPKTRVSNKTRTRNGNNIINDYVVVKLLGRGSFAKVKLVQHIPTGQLFALKILKKHHKPKGFCSPTRRRPAPVEADAIHDDLLREIAVMKLVDHPNIVKLEEVIDDVEEESVYIIMEYCDGGPVHVLGHPPLPVDQVRLYGAQLASALLYLHSEFLYHRDVKPANVLVAEGVAKLVDFGTCNSRTKANMADGTPAFSCPEQVRGQEVSGEVVDSWAFAMTLFQMAYAKLPFPAKVNAFTLRQHLMGNEALDIPPYPADPNLEDLLRRMLCKDPAQRVLLRHATEHEFFGVEYNNSYISRSFTTWCVSMNDRARESAAHGSISLAGASLLDRALDAVQRGCNLKGTLYSVHSKVQRRASLALRGAGMHRGSLLPAPSGMCDGGPSSTTNSPLTGPNPSTCSPFSVQPLQSGGADLVNTVSQRDILNGLPIAASNDSMLSLYAYMQGESNPAASDDDDDDNVEEDDEEEPPDPEGRHGAALPSDEPAADTDPWRHDEDAPPAILPHLDPRGGRAGLLSPTGTPTGSSLSTSLRRIDRDDSKGEVASGATPPLYPALPQSARGVAGAAPASPASESSPRLPAIHRSTPRVRNSGTPCADADPKGSPATSPGTSSSRAPHVHQDEVDSNSTYAMTGTPAGTTQLPSPTAGYSPSGSGPPALALTATKHGSTAASSSSDTTDPSRVPPASSATRQLSRPVVFSAVERVPPRMSSPLADDRETSRPQLHSSSRPTSPHRRHHSPLSDAPPAEGSHLRSCHSNERLAEVQAVQSCSSTNTAGPSPSKKWEVDKHRGSFSSYSASSPRPRGIRGLLAAKLRRPRPPARLHDIPSAKAQRRNSSGSQGSLSEEQIWSEAISQAMSITHNSAGDSAGNWSSRMRESTRPSAEPFAAQAHPVSTVIADVPPGDSIRTGTGATASTGTNQCQARQESSVLHGIAAAPSSAFSAFCGTSGFSATSPVVQITVSHRHLKFVSSQISAVSHSLDTLDASYNAIHRLAPSIDWRSFTHLTCLVLHHNRFREFPSQVLLAPKLSSLDLSFNRVEFIPIEPVMHAAYLEELLLRHNHIHDVGVDQASGRSVLSHSPLRLVDLSDNPLTSLPPDMDRSKKLQLILDAHPALQHQWEEVLMRRYSVVPPSSHNVSGVSVTQALPPSPGNSSTPADLLQQHTQPHGTGVFLTVSHGSHLNASTSAISPSLTCVPSSLLQTPIGFASTARENKSAAGMSEPPPTTAPLQSSSPSSLYPFGSSATSTAPGQGTGLSLPGNPHGIPSTAAASNTIGTVILWKKIVPMCIFHRQRTNLSSQTGQPSASTSIGLSPSHSQLPPPSPYGSIWIAPRQLFLYRSAALKSCNIRFAVLLQQQHPHFPAGALSSADLARHLAAQEKASDGTTPPLPSVVGKLARSQIQRYFFVDSSLCTPVARHSKGLASPTQHAQQVARLYKQFLMETVEARPDWGLCLFLSTKHKAEEQLLTWSGSTTVMAQSGIHTQSSRRGSEIMEMGSNALPLVSPPDASRGSQHRTVGAAGSPNRSTFSQAAAHRNSASLSFGSLMLVGPSTSTPTERGCSSHRQAPGAQLSELGSLIGQSTTNPNSTVHPQSPPHSARHRRPNLSRDRAALRRIMNDGDGITGNTVQEVILNMTCASLRGIVGEAQAQKSLDIARLYI